MGAQHSHLIYRPPVPPSYSEEHESLIKIPSAEVEGQSFPGMFLEYTNKNGTPALYTILYIGGNAEDIGVSLSWLKTLNLTLRVNVCSFDYPGFGLHEGESSEKACYHAAAAAYDFLVSEKNIEPKNILVMGKDIGAAVAVWLLHETGGSRIGRKKGVSRRASGLILQSPFTSLLAVAGAKVPKFKGDYFDSSKRVEKLTCPIFIAHGSQDELVDVKHGKKLASKVAKETLWKMLELPECGHRLEFEDDYLDDLIEFIEHVGKSDPEYKAVVIQAKPVPLQFTSAPSHVMTQWLANVGMERYVNAFLGSGFFSLDTLMGVDEVDLLGVGIESDEDIEILLKAIRRHFNPEAAAEEEAAAAAAAAAEEGGEKAEKDVTKQMLAGSVDRAVLDDALPVASFLGPVEDGMDVFLKAMDQGGTLAEEAESDAETEGEKSKEELEEATKAVTFAASFYLHDVQKEGAPWTSDPCSGIEAYSHTFAGRNASLLCVDSSPSNVAFVHNALARCQLRHKNVVEAHGFCVPKAASNMLVVEDTTQTLETYLIEKGAELTPLARLNIAIGIAEGLAFLHTRSPIILHQNLSCTTVFMVEDEPKLGRFLIHSKPDLPHMAPETIRQGEASPATDVFCFALVVHEIFSGVVDASDDHPAAVAVRTAVAGARPPLKDVPDCLRKLLQKCWNARPGNRPSMQNVMKLLLAAGPTLAADDETTAETQSLSPQRLFAFPFLRQLEELQVSTSADASQKEVCSATMSAHFLRLLQDKTFADMIFRVGDDLRLYHAHRAIVSARSPLLSGLIHAASRKVAHKPGSAVVIQLPNIPHDTFSALLTFLYSGHLELDDTSVLDVMQHAAALHLDQAVDVCVQYLEVHGLPSEEPETTEIVARGAASAQSQSRMTSVKESLKGVESGIKTLEETLSKLNKKLEQVSATRAPE